MNKIKQSIVNLFKPVDLTKGSPLKVILIFMVPILISLIFQQIYTISDAAIVGNTLSTNEVAGVNVSYSLIFIVLQFAFGCTAGFSVVTSNKMGENNLEGVRKSLACQILISLIISVILTVIAILCIPFLLSFIGIEPSHGDYQYAYDYIFIIYLGLITQVFYNLIVSVLRSVGDSLTPLLFLIESTILNIGLDFLFICAFNMGVKGAAIATVIAQAIAAIACFVYSFVRYDFLRIKWSDFKLSSKFIIEHLKLGLPMAFQFSILAIGLIILQKAVVKFDVNGFENAKNGYGAAVKFNDFLMTPLNALGTAMLSYAGQNYGSKDITRLRKGIKTSFLLMLAFYASLAIIGCLCSIDGAYVHIFLSSEKVNERVIFYASTYMIVDCCMYFALGSLFLIRNILQGLGKSIYPLLSGITELVGRIIICEFLPQLINPSNPISDESFIGLCFSDSMAWILAVCVMSYGIYYYIIKGNITSDFNKESISK